MIFGKNRKTVDLIAAHIEIATQCIKMAGRAIESYIEGNLSEAIDQALQTDALALEASQKMENILKQLCQGTVVAPIREDLYMLANSFDQAVYGATSCSLFFLDRRPKIPIALQSEFMGLAESSFSGHPAIQTEALNCLKGGCHLSRNCEFALRFRTIREKVKKGCRKLNSRILEIDIDTMQISTIETCLSEILSVFKQMTLVAETITRINMGPGN